MKRSTQVSLVVMMTASISGSAYALAPENCHQPTPNATAGGPRIPAADCRSSRGDRRRSGAGRVAAPITNSGPSNAADPAYSAPTANRGGFGSIGAGIASAAG
jgi:hypothetical protein